MPEFFDVSLALSPRTVVYPGNPKVRFKPLKSKTSYLTEITLGSHTGTHVDAPRHVFKNGTGITGLNLGKFFGPCRVLDLTKSKQSILKTDLEKLQIKPGERILAKTRNSLRGFKKFYSDYIYLDGEAAKWLASQRIALFGIDYLSVKQRGSEDVRPHTELLRKGIPIVEGLDLSKIKAGKYTFVGLPLKFVGLDGAPIRAALIG